MTTDPRAIAACHAEQIDRQERAAMLAARSVDLAASAATAELFASRYGYGDHWTVIRWRMLAAIRDEVAS